jgi:hypothetical protein
MDTRSLRPKGMNGLKILSSTRLLVHTNLPTRAAAQQGFASLRRCLTRRGATSVNVGVWGGSPCTALPLRRVGAWNRVGFDGRRGDGNHSHTQGLGAGLELWGGGSVSWTAAPRGLKQAEHRTVAHMAEAGAARRRTAPSPLVATRRPARRMGAASAASTRAALSQPLKAARSIARRMAEAGAARRRAASRELKAPHNIARRMEAAGAANTWAAPRQLKEAPHNIARPMAAAGAASRRAAPRRLKEAARIIARHMAAASGASKRAAPNQSLELPAVRTARYVSSASSPTMRRTMHSNSVARPRRPEPRVGQGRARPSPAAGGAWRATHRLATAVMLCVCV